MLDRGLDLARLDVTTEEEIAAFRAHYTASHGGSLAAYDFWLALDPSQVKRHRLQARWSADDEGRALPLHGTLAFLHLYTVLAYRAGIRYETLHSRSLGCSRPAVLETLALAFIHSGPRGIDAVNEAARDIFDTWAGSQDAVLMQSAFPKNWTWDPNWLRLDLDFTTPEWSQGDWSRLTAWYQRHLGSIPPYAEFLRRSRPGLLKAWWARLEGAFKGALPMQMLPFVMIHFNVSRAVAPGIREGVLLARSVGMTAGQIDEAIAWGTLYGGPAAASAAAQAIAELPRPLGGT